MQSLQLLLALMGLMVGLMASCSFNIAKTIQNQKNWCQSTKVLPKEVCCSLDVYIRNKQNDTQNFAFDYKIRTALLLDCFGKVFGWLSSALLFLGLEN